MALEQPPLMDIYFRLEDTESTCRLDWSPDGKDWQAAPADSGEYVIEEDRIWYRGRIDGTELPFFICVAVIGPDGSESYSDVVRVTDGDYPGESGGNRGGGTDLTPPEQPSADDETDGGGADISSGSPNLPGGNSIQKNAPSVTKRPEESSVSAHPASENPLSSGDSEQKETEQQEVIPPLILSESESAVPADAAPEYHSIQEGNIPSIQEKSSFREKAVVQIIGGIAVTVGIVALTVTWSPKAGWGKRFLRLLCKLLKRS